MPLSISPLPSPLPLWDTLLLMMGVRLFRVLLLGLFLLSFTLANSLSARSEAYHILTIGIYVAWPMWSDLSHLFESCWIFCWVQTTVGGICRERMIFQSRAPWEICLFFYALKLSSHSNFRAGLSNERNFWGKPKPTKLSRASPVHVIVMVSECIVVLQQAILCGKHLTVQDSRLVGSPSRVILAIMNCPDLCKHKADCNLTILTSRCLYLVN